MYIARLDAELKPVGKGRVLPVPIIPGPDAGEIPLYPRPLPVNSQLHLIHHHHHDPRCGGPSAGASW